MPCQSKLLLHEVDVALDPPGMSSMRMSPKSTYQKLVNRCRPSQGPPPFVLHEFSVELLLRKFISPVRSSAQGTLGALSLRGKSFPMET